jgi:hypothetical protein
VADAGPDEPGIEVDVNLSIMFTEVPLLERPQAATAAGFHAVELWVALRRPGALASRGRRLRRSSLVGRAPAVDMRLPADLFHLTSNGEDLSTVLSEYGDRNGHVDVADAPGGENRARARSTSRRSSRRGSTTTIRATSAFAYEPTTTTVESLHGLPRRQRGRLSIGSSQDGAK